MNGGSDEVFALPCGYQPRRVEVPPEPGSADAERHALLSANLAWSPSFYKLPHFVKERSLPFWDLLIVMEADALEFEPFEDITDVEMPEGKGSRLET